MNEIKTSNPLLWDIIEVFSTSNESDVNERLKQGWKLIDTITTCYDPEIFYKHQTLHYILGRTAATPEFIDKTPQYGTNL